VYFNVNFNVFLKIKKVHLLVTELYCDSGLQMFSFVLVTHELVFMKSGCSTRRQVFRNLKENHLEQ